MQIPKPSEADKDRFRSLIPDAPSVEVKPMFGNLGAFVNGNMFAGLFGSAIGVRLVAESSRAELAAVDGTGPFGPAERPMGGYLTLPAEWSETPEAAASAWVERALAEVGALPPKAAKAKPSKAGPAKLRAGPTKTVATKTVATKAAPVKAAKKLR
jgi:TfoX/Sxy family transcriptional regulator of competence genes